MRVGTLIESLSKELYFRELHREDPALDASGTARDILFDSNALKSLIRKWKLDKKVVIISHPNCHQSDRELLPFIKDTERAGKNRMTFRWNNAYQGLKHDRIGNFHEGSVRNLFSAMSALFVLNAYYMEAVFDLGSSYNGLGFDRSLGSGLFSCEIALVTGHDGQHRPNKPQNIDRSLYVSDWTENYHQEFTAWWGEFMARSTEEIMAHSKFQMAMKDLDLKKASPDQITAVAHKARLSLGIDELKAIYGRNWIKLGGIPPTSEYEARLNLHDVAFV